jgi:hypothetical protein
MAKYLTADRIKASITALADTRAKAALMDFLILKRTLCISGQTHVAITQSQPAYLQATKELAGIKLDNSIVIGEEKQIFNVFVSQEASRAGFRGGKYISNGTGSTIGGNPWQSVIELTTDEPRKAGLRAGHEAHLEALLLKAAKGDKPSLGETAVWSFRKTDVEALFAGATSPIDRFAALRARFVADYGMSMTELNALFSDAPGQITDADLQDSPAEPEDYLDGLKVQPAAAVAAATGQLCSLDLVAALAAKPFVILTGASGTGKSRSTLRLAEQLQEHYDAQVKGQIFQLVPIGPDWTSPKKLLGFRSPFGQVRKRPDGTDTNESYEITETLRIILRACHPSSTKIPHFLVFDEMNLSHVERYFAPFLSLMEASAILEDGENAPIIDKHSMQVISELLNAEDSVSAEAESAALLVKNDQPLTLPPNLFYVGTVNVDETTYMFSPKVLDRAHVIEVRALTPSQYATKFASEETIDLVIANQVLQEAIDEREVAAGRDSDPSQVLNALRDKHDVDANELDIWRAYTLQVLDGCYKLLAPVGFEFAFRVNKEIYAYMLVWIKAQIANGATPTDAMQRWVEGLDRALFQKVLPKIHGSRSALGDSLRALHAFLGGSHAENDPPAKYALGAEAATRIEPADAITLPAGKEFARCRGKLMEMHARLLARNYVSFVK